MERKEIELKQLQKILSPSFYNEEENTLTFKINFDCDEDTINEEIIIKESHIWNDIELARLNFWLINKIEKWDYNCQFTKDINNDWTLHYKCGYICRFVSACSVFIMLMMFFDKERIDVEGNELTVGVFK